MLQLSIVLALNCNNFVKKNRVRFKARSFFPLRFFYNSFSKEINQDIVSRNFCKFKRSYELWKNFLITKFTTVLNNKVSPLKFLVRLFFTKCDKSVKYRQLTLVCVISWKLIFSRILLKKLYSSTFLWHGRVETTTRLGSHFRHSSLSIIFVTVATRLSSTRKSKSNFKSVSSPWPTDRATGRFWYKCTLSDSLPSLNALSTGKAMLSLKGDLVAKAPGIEEPTDPTDITMETTRYRWRRQPFEIPFRLIYV